VSNFIGSVGVVMCTAMAADNFLQQDWLWVGLLIFFAAIGLATVCRSKDND